MNKRMARPLFLLSLAAYAASVAAQSADLTGEWEVYLRTPNGDYTMTATIKQEGEKLSGSGMGQSGIRSASLQGTIHGKEVRVVCTVARDTNLIQMTLTGKVEGDSIKGKAVFGGIVEGEWHAKRLAEGAKAGTNRTPVNNAQSGVNIDVNGTWDFEVETEAGSSYPIFTFKQEGETLTGQCKGAFGEAFLTGTVKDNEIMFSFKIQAQGSEVTFTYTGIIEKNSMKGIARIGETDWGSWITRRR